MPTYEYHCTSCNKNFEAKQRMSDKPLTVCECGSEGTVSRQMGMGAGIIFKGTGFYETDYKKKDSGSSASSSSSTSSSSESSSPDSSTKTESKPSTETKSSSSDSGSSSDKSSTSKKD